MIDAGVVPRFVEFLMREDYPQLQVCWIRFVFDYIYYQILYTLCVCVASV